MICLYRYVPVYASAGDEVWGEKLMKIVISDKCSTRSNELASWLLLQSIVIVK